MTITKYLGHDKEVVIPSEIDGVKVTIIGSFAFASNRSLESVKIPNTVKTINNNAFYDCNALKNVEIPNSVTSIERAAFGMDVNLESIDIPNSVTNLGEWSFYYCSNLKNVKLSNRITTLKEFTFYYCKNLESIEIPKSVTSIERDVFSSCSKFKSIYGEEGSYAQTYAEENNISFIVLEKEKVTDISQFEYTISEDLSVSIDKYIGKDSEVIIPSEVDGIPVTSINRAAFQYCESIKSVKMPKGVTSIGVWAFWGCTSLESVDIPKGVTYIGDDAFYSCENLKSIDIPEGVTCISYSTFRNCSNLTNVKIPNTVTSIELSAFLNCSGLTSIELPNSITNIGVNAFLGCSNLKSIEIPEGVISIGNDAFFECINLRYIIIPKSVTSIGETTFGRCYNLEYVYGEEGSYVQNYLNGKKIKFENIDNILNINNFKILRRSNTSLVLSWDEVLNAQGYEIYRATSENGKYVKVKTITDNSILTNTSTGLESATSYYYKIKAYKEHKGQKIYGKFNLLKATTNPDKITGLKLLDSTSSSLKIGWDKYDKATGYEVYRATNENGKYIKVKTITDNNIIQNKSPNLDNGKMYYYRVKAYIEVDGQKYYSDSATLQASTKLSGGITNLKMVSRTDNSIRISWDKVESDEGYEVFRGTSEKGKYVKVKTITDNNITSIVSTGLNSATTYYYKVRSYKTIDGNKQYGDFSTVKISTKPKAVDNLVLVNSTEKSIKIAWDEVKGADGYEIFKATGENGKYVKVATTSDLNYVSLGVVKGQSYCYKVKAYKVISNKKIYGDYSKIIEVTVK